MEQEHSHQLSSSVGWDKVDEGEVESTPLARLAYKRREQGCMDHSVEQHGTHYPLSHREGVEGTESFL